ncbi:MAG: endonuclease/exonuclease/phosphatase family protein [Candidatus Dependentiae bacterium]|nr:endonuclease/exonuclease/phosphatase family protein [Candidatus Dependentiae bacterium]
MNIKKLILTVLLLAGLAPESHAMMARLAALKPALSSRLATMSSLSAPSGYATNPSSLFSYVGLRASSFAKATADRTADKPSGRPMATTMAPRFATTSWQPTQATALKTFTPITNMPTTYKPLLPTFAPYFADPFSEALAKEKASKGRHNSTFKSNTPSRLFTTKQEEKDKKSNDDGKKEQQPKSKYRFGSLAGILGATILYGLNSDVAYASDGTQDTPPASMWEAITKGYCMPRHMMIESFVEDCEKLAHKNNDIPKHVKNDTTVRIATYNVHSWYDAYNKRNFGNIMQVIEDINADILVLQEVSVFDWSRIEKSFKRLGYICTWSGFAKAADHGGHPFGNMIVSKYPLTKKPVIKTFDADKKCQGEQRCYVNVTAKLPQNKQVTLYGTHFDVYDETENRRELEVKELVDTIVQQPGACMIAADCNAVRSRDYQWTIPHNTFGNAKVWDLLNASNQQRTGMETQTKALATLENNEFQDCFTKNKQQCPKFTVWSGTAVDFMYLDKKWDLPIAGCHTYYSSASDHLPVIMDVKVKE